MSESLTRAASHQQEYLAQSKILQQKAVRKHDPHASITAFGIFGIF
ncbi:hypothetical protein [Trichococcus collinsii]|nr:hypothetical protein [Trichococcus collinsii]